MGFLSGYVVQGRNLARADLFDKSDPYAVIRLKDSECKTPAEMNVDSPMWRFPIPPIPVPEGCSDLEVGVWDYNAWTAHKPLGRCTVQLQDVIAACGTKVDQWHKLDTQGEVRLNLTFLPKGQDSILRNPSFVDREKGGSAHCFRETRSYVTHTPLHST
jgi:Ca2+-dependent lipid-binding protein